MSSPLGALVQAEKALSEPPNYREDVVNIPVESGTLKFQDVEFQSSKILTEDEYGPATIFISELLFTSSMSRLNCSSLK